MEEEEDGQRRKMMDGEGRLWMEEYDDGWRRKMMDGGGKMIDGGRRKEKEEWRMKKCRTGSINEIIEMKRRIKRDFIK